MKLVALLCCLVPTVTLVVGLVMPKRTAGPLRPMSTADIRAQRARNANANQPDWRTLIPIVLVGAGALFMLVDAFRREYDAPKALPIAIAIMGLPTFGMLSLVYYGLWGWMPLRPETPRAEAFCPTCVGETIDWPAPRTLTINGLFGTRLIGRAQPCATCGSTVKTLWLQFLLPLIPFGSYRVLTIGKPRFDQAWYLSRRLPSLRWGQALPLLLLATAAVGLIVYLNRTG